ncbi:MAG: class I tRNA ligase family protein, partial [Bacilli bacterium]
RNILTYMTNDLSAFYLDFTKDVLYIESKNNLARRSIQTVLYDNLSALVKLLTPIIPFTTEEVYSYMNDKKEESVYLTQMPTVSKFANTNELLAKYDEFFEFRDDILKAIEVARNSKIIGKSLSAKVEYKPNEKVSKLISSLNVDLKQLFIVSEFVVTNLDVDGDQYDTGVIKVTARDGIICNRCWQVVDNVDEDGLCPRCEDIVENWEE